MSFSLFSFSQTDHTIVTQGLAYNPADLTVSVGDNVTIVATGNHPTTEVSEATWNANGITPLPGGFGTNTSSFTFTVTEPGVIYYVCDNHVASSGMKGVINVNPVGVDELVNEIAVNFGKMPIEDGILRYSITAPENRVGMIKVISLGGQEILSESLDSNEGQFDLRASSGVYVVLLKDREGETIFRETISVK